MSSNSYSLAVPDTGPYAGFRYAKLSFRTKTRSAPADWISWIKKAVKQWAKSHTGGGCAKRTEPHYGKITVHNLCSFQKDLDLIRCLAVNDIFELSIEMFECPGVSPDGFNYDTDLAAEPTDG